MDPKPKSTSGKLLSSLVLRPISWAYGAVTATRNKLFDIGVLTQREFDIPILVIGNIAVGGTGKTPHTEYVLELLRHNYKIGMLSRGYNRHTKGFVMATDQSDARSIGDEPYQIYQKFGKKGVTVAVCEDRCVGIDKMRELNPEINLIVLDDAFQHRYVKPTASVVLTEYSHPVFNDTMLPAGRLREGLGALHRADIVVVTKCPSNMKQLEYRLFVKNLDLYPYQKLYFSQYNYGDLVPVFPDDAPDPVPQLSSLTNEDTIVALAGVANPRPFIHHLKTFGARVKGLAFSDHHNFTLEDMALVLKKIKSATKPKRAIVVTTEKDAMRLRSLKGIPPWLRSRMFYIPVSVNFIPNVAEVNQAGSKEFAETLSQLLSGPKQL